MARRPMRSISTAGANTVNVAIGNTHTSKLHAALWTAAGSLVDLGVLPGDVASIATGISADGTVVVGISDPVGLSGQSGTSGYGYNAAPTIRHRWSRPWCLQAVRSRLAGPRLPSPRSSIRAPRI